MMSVQLASGLRAWSRPGPLRLSGAFDGVLAPWPPFHEETFGLAWPSASSSHSGRGTSLSGVSR